MQPVYGSIDIRKMQVCGSICEKSLSESCGCDASFMKPLRIFFFQKAVIAGIHDTAVAAVCLSCRPFIGKSAGTHDSSGIRIIRIVPCFYAVCLHLFKQKGNDGCECFTGDMQMPPILFLSNSRYVPDPIPHSERQRIYCQ